MSDLQRKYYKAILMKDLGRMICTSYVCCFCVKVCLIQVRRLTSHWFPELASSISCFILFVSRWTEKKKERETDEKRRSNVGKISAKIAGQLC